MLYHADIDQMTGINERWNPPVSLHLKKFSEPIVKEYYSEELTFFNRDVKLAGTLIKPAGEGPFPGVVIVHGSGAQGRGDWEYRSHGYSLAKRGVAVLLYDKRGVGESTGDFRTANFEDLAGDAIAGINALRSHHDIENSAVGLLGVSQGGWISAITSGKEGKPAFVILLQGPAVSLEEQEFHRVKYSMFSDGFASESIDSAITHTRNYFQYVNALSGWDKLMASSDAVSKSTWAEYVNTTFSQDDPDLVWWRNNAYDPADDLKSIGVPVLSIFGEIDTAVPVEENRSKMERYLTAAGVAFEIVVIPNMHHSVTTYQGLYGGDMWKWPEVYWNWSRRPAMLDDTIARWVAGQAD
jgi:pimeloyl-ACP methyl ester carboxylesterase